MMAQMVRPEQMEFYLMDQILEIFLTGLDQSGL
jgi:hypothetical protein